MADESHAAPQYQQDLAGLMVKLTEDPRTRMNVIKEIKKLDPSMRFPDLDNEDLRAELTKRLDEDKAERERERMMSRLEKQRAKVAERYDDGQMKEIEGLMEKHAISDYNVAAKLYAADQPPPREKSAPQHRHGDRWELPNLEEYQKDPRGAARREAYKAIDELKLGSV